MEEKQLSYDAAYSLMEALYAMASLLPCESNWSGGRDYETVRKHLDKFYDEFMGIIAERENPSHE